MKHHISFSKLLLVIVLILLLSYTIYFLPPNSYTITFSLGMGEVLLFLFLRFFFDSSRALYLSLAIMMLLFLRILHMAHIVNIILIAAIVVTLELVRVRR